MTAIYYNDRSFASISNDDLMEINGGGILATAVGVVAAVAIVAVTAVVVATAVVAVAHVSQAIYNYVTN